MSSRWNTVHDFFKDRFSQRPGAGHASVFSADPIGDAKKAAEESIAGASQFNPPPDEQISVKMGQLPPAPSPPPALTTPPVDRQAIPPAAREDLSDSMKQYLSENPEVMTDPKMKQWRIEHDLPGDPLPTSSGTSGSSGGNTPSWGAGRAEQLAENEAFYKTPEVRDTPGQPSQLLHPGVRPPGRAPTDEEKQNIMESMRKFNDGPWNYPNRALSEPWNMDGYKEDQAAQKAMRETPEWQASEQERRARLDELWKKREAEYGERRAEFQPPPIKPIPPAITRLQEQERAQSPWASIISRLNLPNYGEHYVGGDKAWYPGKKPNIPPLRPIGTPSLSSGTLLNNSIQASKNNILSTGPSAGGNLQIPEGSPYIRGGNAFKPDTAPASTSGVMGGTVGNTSWPEWKKEF